MLPDPRAQSVAIPAGHRGQLLGTDNPEADDDHADAGDRHRRQRLPQRELAAERTHPACGSTTNRFSSSAVPDTNIHTDVVYNISC